MTLELKARLMDAMLQVLDNPTDDRVIICTRIPSLDDLGESMYYMLDKSDDNGETAIKGKSWRLTNSDGAGSFIACSHDVIQLLDRLPDGVIERIHLERY